jgi:type II secretory ATPase GspE/PulE/Tfp pilus assembly ATPase PilB-like protein
MQVNPDAGLTIAAALRAFLRQDADIILAASLGNLETITLAMEASLSGHLVLAAQEADDTVAALSALLELGAKPPLVAATVTGIVAVRLVRKVCAACKRPVDVSALPALKALLSQAAEGGYQAPAGTTFFQAAGCEQCRGKGYTGETGLYEVLTMTEPLADATLCRASAEELAIITAAGGLKTLLADGVRKAAAGQTTLEEVLRVMS